MSDNDRQIYAAELEQIEVLLESSGVPLAAAWFKQAGGGDAIPRYLTYLQLADSPLEKAFSLLYETLPMEQQRLLQAAGIFAPGVPFTRDALEAVFNKKLPPLPPFFIVQAGENYQIPFTPPLSNVGSYRQRHLNFYRKKVEHWLSVKESVVLAAEIAQFGQALHYADAEELVGLVLMAGQYLQTLDEFHSQLAAWLEYVLHVADEKGAEWGHAEQMRALGDLAVRVRQPHTARTFYYRAMLLYDTSMAGQAHTFKRLGDLNKQGNHLQTARDFYYKALLVYELNDFKLGQANTMRQLAQLSDTKTAQEYYEKALAIYEELDLQMGEGHTRKEMADLAMREGNIASAQAHYEIALRIFQKIGFRVEEGHILRAIGDMYLQFDDGEAARTHYDRALSLYEKAGHRQGQADVMRVLGNLALKQKRYNAAIALFRQAHTLYEAVEAHQESAAVSQVLAFLRLEQGNPAEAIRHMHAALTALDKIGASRHEAENRLRDIAMQVGENFPVLWKEITNDAPLSRRLQNILNPALQQALHSAETLQQAIQENILKQVARLESEARTKWLLRALDLPDSENAETHLTRALLYKELASVPEQDLSRHLHQALAEYESALQYQQHSPAEFASTQLKRVALLRDMAGLPGEERMTRLYQALAGFELALNCLKDDPATYATTQFQRANLLRELAGLNAERDSRSDWMYKALAAYDEVIMLLPPDALEHAAAHTNRASLLQEIAQLPDENRAQRLKEALASVTKSLKLLENHGDNARSLRLSTRKLTVNIRDTVVAENDPVVFDTLWDELTSAAPKPEWLS